ncbi:MAG: primosomal protein N' [Bacteroidales bacterium]|nr:primosomal protein N' [Bacteroidales bacterium]
MAERITLFADVLLPLHLPDTYTYRVPHEYNDSIEVGQRVAVQFGKKRLYSAVVRRVHDRPPTQPAKYILAILDLVPLVSERQLRFWEWMATYYMCYPGDVMAVAMPAALKLSSESSIALHPHFDASPNEMSADEIRIVEALDGGRTLSLDAVSDIVGYQKTMPLIQSMIERRIISMEEELKQRYTPREATFLTLHPDYQDEAGMKQIFDELEHSKRRQQLSAFMKFMQLSRFGKESVKKSDLTACPEVSPSSLSTLVKHGTLVEERRVVSRLTEHEATSKAADIILNAEQQAAYETLRNTTKQVSLLHGVTSSGKTEVYIKLIDDALQRGQQALLLLPEIALTAQIINRLRRYFGSQVGVYHSRFNPNERVEVWQRTSDPGPQGFKVLLGARSALFLPFHNLGLVVVDEEHDSSYKQADPAPRYHGRDSAIYLAHLWGDQTHVVLGSATPSIESYHNAQTGRYGLVSLKHRFGGLLMPEVLCADLKEASRRKEMRLNFSHFLIQNIEEALANKEQVILFQNRRGFSLHLECDACHWIPQCQHCDVSLVYHKSSNSLRCHYCGYAVPLPTECPACHSHSLKMKGVGTERIEEDLALLFPSARVARMDLDSTTQKNKYLDIISDFEERRIDILVGTQMVTKGLDFDHVSVVGILNADNLLSYPDFRAYERAFQLMTQVSGRAGRHGKRGKVIIQTYQPWHQAIRDAMDNNYESMFKGQMEDRRIFRYPPFYKLVSVTLRHREKEVLDMAAAQYAVNLRTRLGARVIGPEYPPVGRVRNLYIKRIIVRFERSEPVAQGKQIIRQCAETLLNDKAYGRLLVGFDVDPA